MEQDRLERIARRNVARRMGFAIHASVYVLVNAGLIAINVLRADGSHWSLFPALCWGIGLLAHALAVFFSTSGVRDQWVERERRRLAEHAAR